MYLDDQLQLPRLTGTVRAFSNVSKKFEDVEDSNIQKRLLEKRKQQQKIRGNTDQQLTSVKEFGWQALMSKLVPNYNDQKLLKLKNLLEKLRNSIGKQLLNEDFNDSSLLNDAAYFIMYTFYQHLNADSTASSSNFHNLDKLSKKLKDRFGQFPRNVFDNCKETMENIFDELNSLRRNDLIDEFFNSQNFELIKSDAVRASGAQTSSNEEEYFGQHIKFISYYEPENLIDEDENEFLSSSDESETEDDSYHFQFPTDSTSKKSEKLTQDEIDYTRFIEWTYDLSSDIVTIVYETLCKSSDQVQNELVELLGYDKIELVEFLFTNRTAVVNAYKAHLDDQSSKRQFKSNANMKQKASNAPPTISSEITVHTETEKKLKKLMLKDKKRMNRFTATAPTDESIQFDPHELKRIREEQLAEAHMLQIYNQKRMENLELANLKKNKLDQYPYIFDSMLKTIQTTAFIAGSKIMLPDTIKRFDSNTFEEIFIPPSDPFLPNAQQYKSAKEEIIFRELRSTSELDPVGQIAFRNVKTLNRIQSIVFDSAYNTNENLLICAPTGAGKTNIAMLTIVNEIRRHYVGGVLKKDDFKIVYIAPMKALAAEMVDNFSKRLEPLGLVVRELTGDMQLSKQEIMQTQMLVTTPEKWDVVTRKSLGDISLSLLVKLLIIDEVHLLHDDRGSVIETVVARTLRQVESTQKMIRIVGLSATLPNYMDVARFLNVDPKKGLFFFDSRFRPVPLAQTFIGVKSLNKTMQLQQMEEVCYDKVLKLVKQGHQVMVFVHARNATIKTALKLREIAKNQGEIEFFRPEQSKEYGEAQRQMQKSKNKQLREIFDEGFGVHHAGMLRADRNLVERLFVKGFIRVLVCTATLAWGVNLPAHAVVIKGTELYDANKGSFVDLSMLDILQIFGRAGRPQYDKSGEAFIITTHNKLAHYLSLLTQQTPIESQFINNLADNLNAEICLGSVTNVSEGVKWLSYTYLYVRMRFNPLAYGITFKTLENDPGLSIYREELIRCAARLLDKERMIRFDEATGSFNPTDLGRTASHYYIKYNTVEVVNSKLKETLNDKEIFGLMSDCSEFQQLKVRDEEIEELDILLEGCELPVLGGIESTQGKVNCLIQAYISRNRVDGFSLISDMAYVGQNLPRIARALFEVALKRGWALISGRLLNVCKSIEKQLWSFSSPMRQFENVLTFEILNKIEEKRLTLDKMREMSGKELGIILHHQRMGDKVKECLSNLPVLEIETSLHPITRTVLRVKVTLTADFSWNDRLHGSSEFFWIWIEDPSHNHIYHHEYFNLQKKYVKNKEPQTIVFTIPIFEPLPSQYIIRVISDKWLGVEFSHSVSFKHLILPDQHPPHTELLDLDPLPITALNNSAFEALYPFTHFNPIQTQIFFCLYHTDNNCLLGAPTGSGKTISAELAMFRVFNKDSRKKVVYIAPLKALVRERMVDWKKRLEEKLGKKVVELTGDVAPDMKIVAESDVIVTTPEKWDGISRSWQTRNYVKDVALIVIDEIHLLGEDRGPVLEVIVSRTNFISSHTNHPVRIIGLSTALANARDLANWLGIKQMGLYNFKPSVRPVPLEVHIKGFAGKFYCPRMATMNKPCFQDIKIHSPDKPVLIFVSSRRQTRLTALDLISCLANEGNPKQWLTMPEHEINNLISQLNDQNLKLTLAFGIGLHHAGLNDKDRRIVEELFLNQKIQVLIATSTVSFLLK
jgi:activating signal cointegrator complex subunit 3